MPLDYWLTDGCTVHGFARQNADPRIAKRHNFLRKYAKDKGIKSVYPFVHGLLHIGNLAWYHPSAWGLDPLVVPILKYLNTLNGVRTFSSCQGSDVRSPSIAFSATEDGALNVLDMIYKWHRQINEGWYWNEAIVALSGRYEGRTEYNLWFYDILALMKFTKEYLKVPIAEQIVIPKQASTIEVTNEENDYGLMLEQKFIDKLSVVTAEEIEQVLE